MGEAKRSKLVNNEAVATMGVGILQISGGLFEIEIGLSCHHTQEGRKSLLTLRTIAASTAPLLPCAFKFQPKRQWREHARKIKDYMPIDTFLCPLRF